MVLVDSDRISHVPPYSGYCYRLNAFRVQDYHLYRWTFQIIPLNLYSNVAVLQPRNCRNNLGLGYFHFARHYYGNHYCFLFLRLLRCFSSARLPPLRMYGLQPYGFPHSEMHGLTDICSSPCLIAAYHVFLRLSEPRHSPCALSNLLVSIISSTSFTTLINSNMSKNFVVEDNGVEPLTPCVQGRCSSQLS